MRMHSQVGHIFIDWIMGWIVAFGFWITLGKLHLHVCNVSMAQLEHMRETKLAAEVGSHQANTA